MGKRGPKPGPPMVELRVMIPDDVADALMFLVEWGDGGVSKSAFVRQALTSYLLDWGDVILRPGALDSLDTTSKSRGNHSPQSKKKENRNA